MWDLPRPGIESRVPCISRQILHHGARQHCTLRLAGGMISQWNCWQYHSVLWGHINDGYKVRGRQTCRQTSACCIVTASSRQPLQSCSFSSVNRDHNHVHHNRLLWESSKIMYARHLTWYVYSTCSVNISNTKRNAEEVPGLFHSTGCSEGLGALPLTRDLEGEFKEEYLISLLYLRVNLVNI